MTLLELLNRAREYPLFTLEECRKWFPGTSRRTAILQLCHYVARGHILRAKRGLFVLNAKSLPHPWVFTTRLDPQAVISLETVLHEAGRYSPRI